MAGVTVDKVVKVDVAIDNMESDLIENHCPIFLLRAHYEPLEEKCILTHLLPSIKPKDFLNEKPRIMTSAFPNFCDACLSNKFGLSECYYKGDSFFMNCMNKNAKIRKTTSTIYHEGPYFKALRSDNGIAFEKDTIIFPVGSWLLDILTSDFHSLYHYFSYFLKIIYKGDQYSLNPYIFDYFKNLNIARRQPQPDVTRIDSFSDILNYCLIPTQDLYDYIYDVDSILMCQLLNPTAAHSKYISEGKSIILEENKSVEIKVDEIKDPNRLVTESKNVIVSTCTTHVKETATEEQPRMKSLDKVLFSYISPMRVAIQSSGLFLSSYFDDKVSEAMVLNIASHCVPMCIKNNDTLIRKVTPNTRFIEGIGLVTTSIIYKNSYLIIDKTVALEKFVTFKMNRSLHNESLNVSSTLTELYG